MALERGVNFSYFDYLYDKIDRNKRYGSVADRRICGALARIVVEPEVFERFAYDQTRLDDMNAMREEFLDNFDPYNEDNMARAWYSAFEFLVAFASKIENLVMSNSIYGDRTEKWFWSMLENLDITYETCCLRDGSIDLDYISSVFGRWVNRIFCYNGDGSPFPLKNPPEDMRNVPFWRHAMLWFTENFEGKW